MRDGPAHILLARLVHFPLRIREFQSAPLHLEACDEPSSVNAPIDLIIFGAIHRGSLAVAVFQDAGHQHAPGACRPISIDDDDWIGDEMSRIGKASRRCDEELPDGGAPGRFAAAAAVPYGVIGEQSCNGVRRVAAIAVQTIECLELLEDFKFATFNSRTMARRARSSVNA